MAHSQYAKRYPLGKSIRDHARNRTHPNVDNQAISQQLENLVKPCVYNQLADYRSLGMRERILSLPLMLAAVLFEKLTLAQSDFITRLKSKAKYKSISILSQSSTPKRYLSPSWYWLSR